ncbi:MAG: hypothetical protein KAH03_00190 [Cocleimonas sp.]|nr:hypothetical protein [Cocleimonas sp.]
MIHIDHLNEQNHEIAELTKVLSYMINDREICDTDILNNLFFSYIKKVTEHLQFEEKNLYQALMIHSDNKVRQTANRFLSGSSEIKRVFKQYQKRWCRHNKLYIKNHAKFMQDSDDMFELVFDRIVDEAERLYPVVRDVMDEMEAA